MPNLQSLLVGNSNTSSNQANDNSGTLPKLPPPATTIVQPQSPSVSFAPPTISSTHQPRSATKSRNPDIARTAASQLNGVGNGNSTPGSSGRPSPSRSPSRAAMPENVPGFKYRDDYSPQLPAFNRTTVNADEDEEIELGLHTAEDEEVSAELRELYNSFQVCQISISLRRCNKLMWYWRFLDLHRSSREIHRPLVPEIIR